MFIGWYTVYMHAYIHTHIYVCAGTCTHRHKRGLEHLPFIFLERKWPFFWGVLFIFINEYMCACVFLFAHCFPCQTNTRNLNIMSGQEMRLCRVPMPFSSPRLGAGARTRAAQHCSTHRSVHTPHRREALPPSLSSCVCLGVEVEWW